MEWMQILRMSLSVGMIALIAIGSAGLISALKRYKVRI